MARGDKSSYTDKQKRMAEHIEESYEDRGVSEKEAEHRAWATVNKETGGGQRGSHAGRKGGAAHGSGGSHGSDTTEHTKRSQAARKGWETRRKNGNA